MQALPDHNQAAYRCALIMALVTALGTLGFSITETEWTLWKSLYFTLITITTVGYGDQGLSSDGQIVAAMLLLGGIGGFTYSVSTLVQIAMDRETTKARKMMNQISNLQGHVVICGFGRMGESIMQQLIARGKQCVVIEAHEQSYQAALDQDLFAIQGSASEDETLIAAGVERAEAVIAAVNSDAENMYIIVSARALNANCSIIARAETASASRKMERAGATFIVMPHMMAGESVATAILNPRLTQAMHNSVNPESRLILRETTVQPGSELTTHTLAEYGKKLRELVFVAMETADGQLIMRPHGEQVFKPGDVLICAGKQEDLQAICEAASPTFALV